MMNRYYFISLERSKQLEMLQAQGEMLHERFKGKYLIGLFKMKNFYIEVWVDGMKNQLEDLVTFKDKSLLNYKFNLDRNMIN
jgi:hypothetical protein